MGVDFSGVSGDMEERTAAAVRQILAMDASPEYKKKRLLELLRRTGNAYHDQLFKASSEVFDSTAIQAARHDAKEQAERLATKLLRNNALNRETIDRLMGSYYNSLQGSAQEEAFRNAQSMQKHPTLTRSVNGVGDCKWCVSKSGTYTNPKGDDFRRHAKCDCKFEVSGYRSRNGELRNYSKKKPNPMARRTHLKPVAEALKAENNENAHGIAEVMTGEKKVHLFKDRVSDDITAKINRSMPVADKIQDRPYIRIDSNYLAHIDNSGHLTGIGRGKNGHDDPNPLTTHEIARIPDIIREGKNIKYRGTIRGAERLSVMDDNKQVVVFQVSRNRRVVSVVTSYKKGK